MSEDAALADEAALAFLFAWDAPEGEATLDDALAFARLLDVRLDSFFARGVLDAELALAADALVALSSLALG